jgi:hypothetical protein
MQFLKRHFEKIILSAVLAGLGAAAFWLFDAVTRAKTQTGPAAGKAPTAKPWTSPDLTPLRTTLKNMTDAPTIAFSGEHNLFNPVTWKLARDGRLFKQIKEGPSAVTVTDIRPLYFTIRLERQAGESFNLVARHPFGPERSFFPSFGDKGPKTAPYPCVIVGTNDAFQNPPKIQILIPDTKETVTLTAADPYKRVEMYEADMKYNASDTNNVFNKQHVGDRLRLSGEPWKIVAITTNAVTLQDRTLKREERDWSGGH